MKSSITTTQGIIQPGTRIRIIKMNDEVPVSRAFPDGIDHGARRYNGKEGTVQSIDDQGQLHGTWGGLAVIPDEDSFEIIK